MADRLIYTFGQTEQKHAAHPRALRDIILDNALNAAHAAFKDSPLWVEQ